LGYAAAGLEKKRSVNILLVTGLEGKIIFGRPAHRWKDLNTYLKNGGERMN
jgi:hypothetical protein